MTGPDLAAQDVIDALDSFYAHRAVSIMIIDEPARIRYYTGDALRFESRARSVSPPGVRVTCMEPEGPHSVQNIDQRRKAHDRDDVPAVRVPPDHAASNVAGRR